MWVPLHEHESILKLIPFCLDSMCTKFGCRYKHLNRSQDTNTKHSATMLPILSIYFCVYF